MKKQRKKYRIEKPQGGFDHVTSTTGFYSFNPVERPLSEGGKPVESHAVGRTRRHDAAEGRGPQKMDPREKMALIAILKLAVLIIVLIIVLFMLRMGIKLYEESIWVNTVQPPEASPLLQEVDLVQEFDIADQASRDQFAERVEMWKEAERLVANADLLLQRKIYDEAILLCQEALRHDPAHLGALERLGELHYAKGDYVKAVNAYIRLLSVDPSRKDTRKKLIESLSAYGDFKAVKYMAEWYREENRFDAEVDRYLARAHFGLEEYEEAARAYERVLVEIPDDYDSMDRLATACMRIGAWEKALRPLEKLRTHRFRDPVYMKNIAVCHAQLEQPSETVQVLVRAAQTFGQQVVLSMIQDPQLDPVRTEREFRALVDRIGGEEFRMGLEDMMIRETSKPLLPDVDERLRLDLRLKEEPGQELLPNAQ